MSNNETELTQSQLKELLHYDPDTGDFTWKVKNNKRISIGAVAGCLSPNGYIVIGLNGKLYSSHRLAFLYMTGHIPKDQIDHINHDKGDNRWSNLRECTQSQNGANRKLSINNTSGYKGVHWNKPAKKWIVQIKFNNNKKHLGYFDCKHEAALAYNKAAIKYHGEFACLNEVPT